MREADYLKNQLGLFDNYESPIGGDAGSYGRTYQVHLQADQSVVLTLEPCLKASQKPVFQCLKMEDGQTPEWFNAQSAKLHGECLTLNIGESPSVAVASSLSQILQPKSDVPQKCYLSSRACQGILRRAARRGKTLPPSLKIALERQAWCIAGNVINRKDKNGGHHLGVDKDVSFTLNTIDRHAVFSEDKKTYSVQAIGHIVESEKSSTLAARDYKGPRNFVEYSKHELVSEKDKQQEVPLYDISHRDDGIRKIPRGACNTLTARMGTGGGNVAVLNEADRQKTDDTQTVRRLTVTECERLQGLPDGYTDVPVNGKPARESDRLMALGNGMAQPCADYVIQRIVDEVGKT